jgi:NAD(P)-dependent dehydrogenase (short-subunit alcohol dehydrogenase family)
MPGPEDTLTELRQKYNSLLNNNLTSTAVITKAFQPLLYKSKDPKVINVTSGLASMERLQAREGTGNFSQYITTKSGMNGLTVHAQISENGRAAAEKQQGKTSEGERIRYYVVAPGVLKTDFTANYPAGKDPKLGAEVIVQLVTDDKHTYEGGKYWEFEEGKMSVVPW